MEVHTSSTSSPAVLVVALIAEGHRPLGAGEYLDACSSFRQAVEKARALAA